jgi:diguanylate cyclase (GGDEF)-like protein
MPPAPLPDNESARLSALRSYEVLDTTCETAFDNIALLAAQLTGCPMSAVSLIDSERQWFKAKIGLETTETPRAHAFCAYAINEPGKPFIVADASQDARFADNPLVRTNPHIRFYAGVPLVNPQGAALGTLCVIDREPRELSSEHAQTLQCLADSVMTTLELRRAMIVVRDMALADTLTGIPNRPALMTALEQAIARQNRHGTSFILLYLDLDGFKSINDRFGHATGDRVLQEVAAALTACLRTGDVAARLGGDEFAMVLAGDEHDAIGAAERVRAEIEMRMQAQGWAVTASVGAASFAAPPDSPDAALAVADKLMYAAKSAGKNRVKHRATEICN